MSTTPAAETLVPSSTPIVVSSTTVSNPDPVQSAVSPQVVTSVALPTVVRPKIGGTVLASVGSSGATLSIAWCGGSPTKNWDDTSNVKPASPMCLRLSPGSSDYSKNYMVIVKYLDIKFEVGDSMSSLEAAVSKKAKECGVDTIFYVWDSNSETMIDIIRSHSRFMRSQVKAFVADK